MSEQKSIFLNRKFSVFFVGCTYDTQYDQLRIHREGKKSSPNNLYNFNAFINTSSTPNKTFEKKRPKIEISNFGELSIELNSQNKTREDIARPSCPGV